MNNAKNIMEKYEKLFDESVHFGLYKEELYKKALAISEAINSNYEEMDEHYNVTYIQNKLFSYMDRYFEFNNL